MSFRQSIRWRIQAWHGALLLVMTIGVSVAAYRLEKTNILQHSEDELRLRLSALTNTLGRGGAGQDDQPHEGLNRSDLPAELFAPDPFGDLAPPPKAPPGFKSAEVESLFDPSTPEPFYYQAWTRTGSQLAHSATAPADIPQPQKSPQSGQPTIRQRAGLQECYIFTPPGECLLVGRSTAGSESSLLTLAWQISGVASGVLIIGLAGGWWIASRSLSPLAQISSATRRIALGHLDERIPIAEKESELGQLATLMNHTFERLETTFAEQAQFTSDAAHELRTPVSVILAQAQLSLSRERDAKDYREAIETCKRAASRMHSLIESLLQLAIVDAAAEPASHHPCDLAEIAHEQIALTRPLAEARRILLIAAVAPAPCRANEEQIAQVIVNLLANAVKFSPSGTTVHITTENEERYATVSVRDQGAGIPAEHLPHLFQRFYRVEASRNRASGGAGLGLAICQRIAKAHNGTLTVESTEGMGSVFTLRLPH